MCIIIRPAGVVVSIASVTLRNPAPASPSCSRSVSTSRSERESRSSFHTTTTVYDPFVGSGTTVIAGEQEGRVVYAIEIEPAYVDVTVKRWEDFTGQKAIKATTP